ncbi:MAG: MFS transporter [Methanobacteriota archaeon]
MDPALLRLYAATFLFSLLLGVGMPLVPQHLQLTFGAPIFLIGLVAGVHGIMQIVLRLPMGDLADRKGRKPSLAATFVLSFAAGLCYVFGPSPAWVLAGQALFGFASGIFWVAANAYLFDRVTASEIPRATSDYSLALGAAFLVGPPFGGYLVDRFGFAAGFSVFLGGSLLGLVFILSLPEEPGRAGASRPPGGVMRRAARIMTHPDIVISAGGVFFYSVLFGSLVAFYPVYLRGLAMSGFLIGVLIATRQAASMIVRFGLPGAIRRFGPRTVLLVGLIYAAVATALTPLAVTPAALAVLSFGVGIGTGVMVPANLTLVSRGSPKEERGLANGIYGTSLGLGSAVAPWILGALGERYGVEATFLGAGLAGLMGAIVVAYFAWDRPSRPADEFPPPPRVDPVPEPP